MSLIDKDKALDAIAMYLFVNDAIRDGVKVADYRVFAETILKDVPEIDIVRCKECKWHDVCSQNVAMRETYDIYENIEFCSYGERSE